MAKVLDRTSSLGQLTPVLSHSALLIYMCWGVAETLPRAETADTVYFMRLILHDWDDEQCIKILKSVRHAIGDSGASLMVIDVSPPSNPLVLPFFSSLFPSSCFFHDLNDEQCIKTLKSVRHVIGDSGASLMVIEVRTPPPSHVWPTVFDDLPRKTSGIASTQRPHRNK